MKTAIAILRAGRSFHEASQVSVVPVDDIMAEWNRVIHLNKEWPSATLSADASHKMVMNKEDLVHDR